ncbi:hypothetical protein BC829DRAFT_418751, partial [Chytridium lagenaria]
MNNANQGHFDGRDYPNRNGLYSDDEDEEYSETLAANSAMMGKSSPSVAALSVDDHLLPSNKASSIRNRNIPGSKSMTGSPLNERSSPPKAGQSENGDATQGGSVFQEFLANTAQASVALVKGRKDAAPPLNLLTTTPRNFTR